ncbi:unnamed protein product [Didymodactylos carnosus]|uniref:Uncharacterized protein n=1 Tax=Didymodactylos carnosus TaxID=1234261 RepID=A0A814VBU2_9BILA|nr:unnamed protein product [Didymodactylos carnosus]CAF3950212.1 unnamed protein product [Didymodactylos carnosus]
MPQRHPTNEHETQAEESAQPLLSTHDASKSASIQKPSSHHREKQHQEPRNCRRRDNQPFHKPKPQKED